MRTWSTVIGVLLTVASVPAIGGAQVAADADGCGSEEVPCYSEEAGFCTDPTVGDGDGILSASEAYNEDIRVPCWVEVNTCKTCGQPGGGSVYAINVGDVWAGWSGGTWANYPDIYYENGECGYGDYVGAIPRNSSNNRLYFYAGEASALIANCSMPYVVAVQLWAQEYSTTDCTGPVVRGAWYDKQTIGLECTGTDGFRQLADYGIGDCSNTDFYETESAPHMPDFYINPPLDAGYKSYYVWLQTKVWDTAGGQSNWVYQGGCFYVYWT